MAWFFHDGQCSARKFGTGNHYVPGPRTATGAEIVKIILSCVEREDVSAGKIDNVNVITDAGPIRCLIIGPENLDVWFLSERDLQNIRDQMRFDAMVFSEFRRSAGRIEVAKGNEFQTVDFAIPAENFFEGQF